MQGLGFVTGFAVPIYLVSHVPEGHSGCGITQKTCYLNLGGPTPKVLMPSQQIFSLSQLAEVSPTGAVESDGRFQVRMCPSGKERVSWRSINEGWDERNNTKGPGAVSLTRLAARDNGLLRELQPAQRVRVHNLCQHRWQYCSACPWLNSVRPPEVVLPIAICGVR